MIEEISNLREEIKKILESTEYLRLLEEKKINPSKRESTIIASQIKGFKLLFYNRKV